MFSSSKPDLCQRNVEVEENMETEETEEYVTLSGMASENKLDHVKSPLAQLLGNMEKVADEIAKVFITKDTMEKRIELFKIYNQL